MLRVLYIFDILLFLTSFVEQQPDNIFLCLVFFRVCCHFWLVTVIFHVFRADRCCRSTTTRCWHQSSYGFRARLAYQGRGWGFHDIMIFFFCCQSGVCLCWESAVEEIHKKKRFWNFPPEGCTGLDATPLLLIVIHKHKNEYMFSGANKNPKKSRFYFLGVMQ